MIDIYKWIFGPKGRAAADDRDGNLKCMLTQYRGDIRKTERPIIVLTPDDERAALHGATQLGGKPWWPAGEPYPADAAGAPLMLLIQINCRDLPQPWTLPSSGLVQVFIGGDDLYGCNCDQPDRSGGFRVVYHADTNRTPLEKFEFLERHAEGDLLSPLDEPLSPIILSAHTDTMPVDPSDYRFEKLLPQIADDEDLREAYAETHEPPPIRLGGYPSFTQQDPRSYRSTSALGDDCLITLDSTDGMIWGDDGIAQFLGRDEDFATGDFSRVAYNWDCY